MFPADQGFFGGPAANSSKTRSIGNAPRNGRSIYQPSRIVQTSKEVEGIRMRRFGVKWLDPWSFPKPTVGDVIYILYIYTYIIYIVFVCRVWTWRFLFGNLQVAKKRMLLLNCVHGANECPFEMVPFQGTCYFFRGYFKLEQGLLKTNWLATVVGSCNSKGWQGGTSTIYRLKTQQLFEESYCQLIQGYQITLSKHISLLLNIYSSNQTFMHKPNHIDIYMYNKYHTSPWFQSFFSLHSLMSEPSK